ncbi:RHS repeat protein [Salmonella enterica]|nr:RHS repeat protein [Salmonella enterica]ELT3086582.1 RHS repeat protein [Salmonella enterica]
MFLSLEFRVNSRCERGSLSGGEYIYLDKTPEVTWDGDRLTITETATQRVQTIYTPGSFTPLIRVETQTAELAKAVRRTLAEKFQQEANVTFPPELVAMVDSLEAELQRGELSETSRVWLAQYGLTPEQIQNQMEPEYTPQRKIHLYHCDHRGLPLALINREGKTDWSAEYDTWGNVLSENNPHNMKQHIRLPGQQYDEETGLYYNRHRYYDPLQGRYITQDPIGLQGGWNPYTYPLNPLTDIDPLGLFVSILVGLACGLVFDYALDKWKEEHCKDPDADTALGQAGNAASGAAVGTFGGFENKPRGGIAGGGPSGNKTSVYSKVVHSAYKNEVINKETTRVLRNGGRRVAKSMPYVGTAITLYQVYDASNCDD